VPPEWYTAPVWYRANPRGLVAPGGTALFPADETEPDFELELACVIGQRVRSPSREEAEAAIFGYTLFNDWSARAMQREAMKVGLGPNPGKDFASSLGPVIVTRDEFGDPMQAELSARVDGEEWCRAKMSDMRWSFPELIAAVANGNELWPGDVVCSGTVPNGCGLEQGRVLRDGALVELHEAHIGTLAGVVGRAPAREQFWKKT
jgi:2-keto-4-pentenoate hydratase/2-oxohepta-3-ene-1,7-dioic acid hydratase in catechol pathway